MPVRSRRLFGPLTAPTLVATSLVTVPAGRTLVLKMLTAQNAVGAANTLSLYLGSVTLANQLDAYSLSGATPSRFVDLFIVLHPGETLVAQPVSSGVQLAGYGALLLGAPE